MSRGGLQPNNFDLIRLAAALQVVVVHASYFFTPISRPVFGVLELFPGVPAFFFVSGFLISRAWELHPNLGVYFGNRARRLFPALWVTTILTLLIVTVDYGPEFIVAHWRETVLWVVAHGTLGQHWNPAFLSQFGTGSINRSLWTIPIELSFYTAVLFPYFVSRVAPKSLDLLFLIAAAASFAVLYNVPWIVTHTGRLFVHNRIYATPAPWIGMFICGVLAQRHIDFLLPLVRGRFIFFLTMYVALAVLGTAFPVLPVLGPAANALWPLNFFALCACVLSAAFTNSGLADKTLKRNDLSYGLYISHMPILNALVFAGMRGVSALTILLFLSVGFAAVSWFFVEKPLLSSKSATAYRHR